MIQTQQQGFPKGKPTEKQSHKDENYRVTEKLIIRVNREYYFIFY